MQDPEVDVRETGRIVATVLFAGGAADAALVERANAGLARLRRPPIVERDRVVSTPEELAPLAPVEIREPLVDLLFDLSEGEPIRRRVASTYAGLWGVRPRATKSDDAAARDDAPAKIKIAKLLVGELPRHQLGASQEATSMTTTSAYRANDTRPTAPAPVRDPLRERVERIQREALAVIDAVERVIIGKRDVIARTLTALAARGHVLLVDAPGVGKTQLVKAVAASFGLRFGRVQFTPDLLPMDVTGATIYEAHERRFVFRPGPVFTNFLLADEINRATPKTQSALLEVMEERTVSVDGTTHAMADPFCVLATMNPIDHDGTFPLPAAQIDRFMVMLEIGYPSPEDEVRVLDTHLAPAPALASIEAVVSREAFVAWQETVPLIHASPIVKRAAVDLVNGLRRSAGAERAISPRATLAWMRLAQARAMFSGREFVTVEDLFDTAADVLRHRLGVTAAEVHDRLRAAAPRRAGAA